MYQGTWTETLVNPDPVFVRMFNLDRKAVARVIFGPLLCLSLPNIRSLRSTTRPTLMPSQLALLHIPAMDCI